MPTITVARPYAVGLAMIAILGPTLFTPGGDDPGARLEKLADGVYTIIHNDATEDWPHGNTGVVVGQDGVLVVDATYLPSRAAADLKLIRSVTDKPVRYLVNTHWHYDHNNGNGVYRRAFPDIAIIAHQETQRIMAVNAGRYVHAAIQPGSVQHKTIEQFRGVLGQGKDSAGTPLTEARRQALEENVRRRENELTEFAKLEVALPTVTFDQHMTLSLGGGREVQLLHWSRANTPGDVAIYLPGEHIVFTGDLVVHPIPYAYNSSPVDWIGTLRELEALAATTVVPGHGPVMHDYGYVRQVRELLEAVVAQVHARAAEGLTLDQVRKAVDLESLRQAFVAGDATRQEVWDDSIVRALIERAWMSARGSI